MKYTSSQVRMRDHTLSITEVAEASGLKSSALRYYEKAGLIEPETRVGGRRHYSPSVLQRLAVIALLQEVGFTIAEIAQVMARRTRHGGKWRSLASKKLDEIDDHLARVGQARDLLVAALDCGCSDLDSCDLIQERRGRHRKALQTVALRMGPPAS